MNRYTFYYNTSQEDYTSGRDMRQYEIQAKDFQQAFRAIPDKYIHLVNTHLL